MLNHLKAAANNFSTFGRGVNAAADPNVALGMGKRFALWGGSAGGFVVRVASWPFKAAGRFMQAFPSISAGLILAAVVGGVAAWFGHRRSEAKKEEFREELQARVMMGAPLPAPSSMMMPGASMTSVGVPSTQWRDMVAQQHHAAGAYTGR